MTTSATGPCGFVVTVDVGGFGRLVGAPENDLAVLVGADARVGALLVATELALLTAGLLTSVLLEIGT
ncbi:MAG: hypothetical protein ACR2P2_21145 [Nakamurella sp.]